MEQLHGAPGHPQTQGKIERWHQMLKNRILLENDFFQENLEAQIGAFIDYYNNRRYHDESGMWTIMPEWYLEWTALPRQGVGMVYQRRKTRASEGGY